MRALTPTGSVSALTRTGASDLIDLLNNGGPGRLPQRTATASQPWFADYVRRNLGLGDAEFRAWLFRVFHVPGLDDVSTSDLARRVVAALPRSQRHRARIEPPKT